MPNQEITLQLLETTAQSLGIRDYRERCASMAALLVRVPDVAAASRGQMGDALAFCLLESEHFPKPKAIVAALKRQPKGRKATAEQPCSVCNSTGSLLIVVVSHNPDGSHDPRDVACRCDCGHGTRYAGLPALSAWEQKRGPYLDLYLNPGPKDRRILLGLPEMEPVKKARGFVGMSELVEMP